MTASWDAGSGPARAAVRGGHQGSAAILTARVEGVRTAAPAPSLGSMTLSSEKHDVVIDDMTVTVAHHTDGDTPAWTLSIEGQEVDRVATTADCVLTGTIPEGAGPVEVTVRQHLDGTVKVVIRHKGETLVEFNDAVEIA